MQLHEHYQHAIKQNNVLLEFARHARQSNLILCYIKKDNHDNETNNALAVALLHASCPSIMQEIPLGRVVFEVEQAQCKSAVLRADIATLRAQLTYPIEE